MFIVESYGLAVALCWVTMLCWGSWGNTQKLSAQTWRYELFYWDYVIGILLFSLVWGLTLGSIGEGGRGFMQDLQQVGMENFWSAFLGGVIFNASNILLSASMSLAGMSVAFPIGVGLVLGVFVNYFSVPKGDPVTLFGGVFLIVLAIVFNGIASGKVSEVSGQTVRKRGVLIAVCAGILMAFFYRFVAAAMDLENLESPAVGMMTPYSALFVFAIGIFISNFLFNEETFYGGACGLQSILQRKYEYSFGWYFWGVPFGRWEQRAVILLPEQPVLPFPMGWDKGLRWLPHYGGYLEGIQRGSKSTNLLIVFRFGVNYYVRWQLIFY